MNKNIVEKMQICTGFVPVDMQTGANNGDWVSMKNYGRCAIVVFKAAGTAGDDPTVTVKQANDVSGTNAKALNFTRVDSKEGTLTSIGQFTTTTQAAGNTYTNDTLAEKQAIIVIDIKAEDLDADNDFDCVQVSIADTGTNAQLGCALYLLHEPRYGSGTLASAIVD